MSSCTFKNTARNPIYFFTANGTMNSQENNTEAFSGMKRAVETRVAENLHTLNVFIYVH